MVARSHSCTGAWPGTRTQKHAYGGIRTFRRNEYDKLPSDLRLTALLSAVRRPGDLPQTACQFHCFWGGNAGRTVTSAGLCSFPVVVDLILSGEITLRQSGGLAVDIASRCQPAHNSNTSCRILRIRNCLEVVFRLPLDAAIVVSRTRHEDFNEFASRLSGGFLLPLRGLCSQ